MNLTMTEAVALIRQSTPDRVFPLTFYPGRVELDEKAAPWAVEVVNKMRAADAKP